VIKDESDSRRILRTMERASEVASELEDMHNFQLQHLESLRRLSWYKGLADKYTNISDITYRMETMGKTIQNSISNKVDGLFQHVSLPFRFHFAERTDANTNAQTGM
jgi:tRNA isopentenyl-2-thiomethyl-A-37 hydroxylase MiaE